MPMSLILAWSPLIAAGLLAGLMAGLFGVGGGVVVVPAVYAVMIVAGLEPDLAMKLALGTSLASIVFTGTVSASRHQRRAAVDWHLVAALSPGLVIGAGTAGWVAHLAPGEWLRTGFAIFLLLVSIQIARLRPATEAQDNQSPPAVALLAVGLVFGLISGLAGVGGGPLVVPLLLWAGFSMVVAVGTAAACGVAIALAGSSAYILAGWGAGWVAAIHAGLCGSARARCGSARFDGRGAGRCLGRPSSATAPAEVGILSAAGPVRDRDPRPRVMASRLCTHRGVFVGAVLRTATAPVQASRCLRWSGAPHRDPKIAVQGTAPTATA